MTGIIKQHNGFSAVNNCKKEAKKLRQESQDTEHHQDGGRLGAFLTPCPSHDYLKGTESVGQMLSFFY